MGDLAQLAQGDPNFVVQLAVGPPVPQLVPQQPGTGAVLSGQFLPHTARFILKKAHLSAEDLRVFNEQGQLVAVSHHFGKNPYASLDPLGLQPQSQLGEWKSILQVSGQLGMPCFKIRPKAMSRHGRQLIQELGRGNGTHFNVAQQSRLSTGSIRHNMEVCKGEGDDMLYQVLCDLSGRTMNVTNAAGETCIFIQKSVKTLLMNAALGAGSELVIDVAQGVDWTAALAVVYGIQQVGAHWVKDALGNFVVNPLQDQAMGAAMDATGTGGLFNQAQSMTGKAQRMVHLATRVKSEFFA